MRRQPTPREIMDRDLRQLLRMVQNMDPKAGVQSLEALKEVLEEKISSARAYAMTVAQGAPAIGAERMGEFLSGVVNDGGEARPDRLDRFVRTHLERHLLLTGVCSDIAMSSGLAEHLISELRGSTDLREISTRAAREFPGIEAPEFNAHMIETVLREAVGLDGNVPEDGREQLTNEEMYTLVRISSVLRMVPESDPEGLGAQECPSPKADVGRSCLGRLSIKRPAQPVAEKDRGAGRPRLCGKFPDNQPLHRSIHER